MAEKSVQENSASAGNAPISHTNSSACSLALPILRAATVALSVVALSLMILNKEHAVVDVSNFIPTIDPGLVFADKYAKFQLVTALKFYVGAVAAVVGYMFLQMVLDILSLVAGTCKKERSKIRWVVFLFDQAIAYLLVSAVAVAIEIAYLAEKGAEDVMWNPICKYFNHFCNVYAIGVGFCTLATICSFIVAAISAQRLFRHRAIAETHSNELNSNAPHKGV